ncbi:MAG: SHOCT domain-containing protein [Streptococcaceae bacterium]|jgi:hypothetical protein|nr:SHOCT domain-containing protein [Streptococcaceae bacterium]
MNGLVGLAGLVALLFILVNWVSIINAMEKNKEVSEIKTDTTNIADQITQLSALKDSGALTAGEYEIQKNQLLNNLSNINDSGSFGYAALGFFFPIVGLILWLVWRENYPQKSRSARNGMITGWITSVALVLVYFVVIAVMLRPLY